MKPAERVRHPIFARMFVRVAARAMGRGGAEHRREMLDGLSGRVIEPGCGNGLNFAFYPPSVTEVVGVEPEPYLRSLASEHARSAPAPVRVMDGLAGRLPGEDASFDAGVVSLMLCSVSDPRAVLAELFRVIRPGGELRFYEHVLAPTPGLARVQRIVDTTIWPLVAGGCHSARDTRGAIERAGFGVERCREFAFRPCLVSFPTTPHILGRARRPARRL